MSMDIDRTFENIPDYPEEHRFTTDLKLVQNYLDEIHEHWKRNNRAISLFPKGEFSKNGMFAMYYRSQLDGEEIDLESLAKDVVLKNSIGCIINEMCEKASEATLKKLDGAYAHISLEKNTKSYGFMFGLMETLKMQFPIKEYSCQQSTLEQVFNAFAAVDSYAQFNKRLTERRNSSVMDSDHDLLDGQR